MLLFIAFNGAIQLFGSKVGTPFVIQNSVFKNIDGLLSPIGLVNPGLMYLRNNVFEGFKADQIFRLKFNLLVEMTNNTITKSLSGTGKFFHFIRVLQNAVSQTTLVINGLTFTDNHFKNYVQIITFAHDLKQLVVANLNIIGNSNRVS